MYGYVSADSFFAIVDNKILIVGNFASYLYQRYSTMKFSFQEENKEQLLSLKTC